MTENDQTELLSRAYYSAPVGMFLGSTPETVLGTLTTNSEMAVEPPQRDAWLQALYPHWLGLLQVLLNRSPGQPQLTALRHAL